MPRKKHQDARDWIFSPEGFDAGKWGIPASLETHARWLLNCIHFNRVLRGRKEDDFVQLHSDLLAQVFGDDGLVTKVKRLCLQSGLVECDKHYVRGEKSYGYRLGPNLKGVKFRKWTIPGKRFAKRVAEYRDRLKTTADLDDLGRYLRSWVERVKLVNVAEVIARLEEETSREKADQQIDIIDAELWWTKRDDFGERFYSNFTGLVSEIRKHCLSFDGVTVLDEIDIANSQPYQLANLVSKQVAENKKREQEEEERRREEKRESRSYDLGFVPTSVTSFITDCLSGTVYNGYMELEQCSRDEAKKVFFGEVYGWTTNKMKHTRELYPEIAEIVQQWKEDAGDWKDIPRRMQKLESAVMIDKLCTRLMNEYPHIGVITCHDSILCEPQYTQTVVELIMWAHSDLPYAPLLRVNGEDYQCTATPNEPTIESADVIPISPTVLNGWESVPTSPTTYGPIPPSAAFLDCWKYSATDVL